MLSGSCFYFIFYFISFSLPYDVHHLPLGSRPLATCSRCMCGVCSVHSTHTHKHTFLVGAHHFITWGRTRTRARGDTITFIKKQINENYSKLLGQVDIERKIHEPWTFSFKCAQIFRYDAGPTPPDAYSIISYYYALFFIFIAAANCHTVTLLRAAHHSYQCLESVSVVYIRSFRVGGSISICLLRY